MKTLFKIMVTMCIALVLLCTSTFAQNEQSTKSATHNPFGLTLAKKEIVLKSGDSVEFGITVLDGYHSPLLIHENNINTRITTNSFTIGIMKNAEKFSVKIKAKDVKKKETETIYFRAMENNPERKKKGTTEIGIPLIVRVNP